MDLNVITPDFKYNPGFKEDRDLIRDFHVRKGELKLLLSIVSSNEGASVNRHVLLVGPRGVGKTTLARRIAAELRLNARFSSLWYPIVFGEESYNITSAGEFWLECLYHLSMTLNDDDLTQQFTRLKAIKDDNELLSASVDLLTYYSKLLSKRFVVFVENLNAIFDDGQLDKDDAWDFRHTLQTSEHIMIIATATSIFSQISNVDYALFEQFKIHYVEPLNSRSCATLWAMVSTSQLEGRQIRPIQILTGGNPRLIRILAEFTVNNVFHRLIRNLSHIVDQYTDYFKGQLDQLPSTERKVFVNLLDLWDPVLTKEVAQASRLTTNVTGALLDRLASRGAVARHGSRWQATERLFNIYYLMRRRGVPSSRVQALVKFMSVYYAPEQLVTRVRELATEACRLSPGERQDHYYAFSALIKHFDLGQQKQLASSIPSAFFSDPNIPNAVRTFQERVEQVGSDIDQSIRRSQRGNKKESSIFPRDLSSLLAEGKLDDAARQANIYLEKSGGSATAIYVSAVVMFAQGKFAEVEGLVLRALSIDGTLTNCWSLLVETLIRLDRFTEAYEAAIRLTSFDRAESSDWILLGTSASRAGLHARAVEAYERALELSPVSVPALAALMNIYIDTSDTERLRFIFDQAIKRDDAPIEVYGMYSDVAVDAFKDEKLSEELLRVLIAKFPVDPRGWTQLAIVVANDPGRQVEVKPLFAEAIRHARKSPRPLISYAQFLHRIKDADEPLAWQAAFQFAPKSVDVHLANAESLSMDGKYVEAERVLLDAIEIHPEDADVWEALGRTLIFVEKKNVEAEHALLQAIQKAPKNCTALVALGKLYRQEGRLEDAEEQLKKAVGVNPTCGCALTQLVSKSFNYGRNFSQTEDLLKRLTTRFPKRSRAHLLLARYLRFAKNRPADAVDHLKTGIANQPNERVIWDELIDTVISAGNLDLNKIIRDQIAYANPDASVLNAVAWKLHERLGSDMSSLSIPIARAAVAHDPDSWAIKHTLATVLCDGAIYPESLVLMPDLIKNYPDVELSSLIELVCAHVRANSRVANSLAALIISSERGNDLEPLYVALKMFSGEETYVAKEVSEVAEDILQQIRAQALPSLPKD